MERVLRGVRLSQQSWEVLRAWPPLLLPAVAAAGCCAIVIGVLVLPVLASAGPLALLTLRGGPGSYLLLFVALYLCTAIVVFFRVALCHSAACLLDGDATSLHHGVEVAVARLPRIVLWSLVTATVGLVLRLAADRLPVGARVMALIGGAAWGTATYFVVPTLALEDVGPIAAVRTSAGTLRARWGEASAGAGGIGVLTAIAVVACAAAGLALAALLHAIGLELLATVALVLGALAALGAGLVGATLGGVFQTVLYLYAGDGDAGDFDEDDVASAFGARRHSQPAPHPG
jgi:hypothetical protein